MDLVSLLTSTTSKGNPNAWDISKAYYDAGSDAWDTNKAIYSSVNFSVSSEETVPQDLFFKPDGTKMYIVGSSGDDVNEYSLSIPWFVSSASYVQNFSVATQEVTPRGLFFKPDGTKMYICGSTSDDVNEYDLSSAWDISTASYLQNFSVSAQDSQPESLSFKPDGTKMYVIGSGSDAVNEYDLSTPWDISTASYLQNFSVATQETAPTGLFFKPDGTQMFVIGEGFDRIRTYNLSSAWDVSTASYIRQFIVNGQDLTPTGLFFHPDGTGFYIIGSTNDRVYQYTIGGFSVNSQDTSPFALFFKPDGTKMYTTGLAGSEVNEYNLSNPWEIPPASFVQTFSVVSQDNSPLEIFFKTDGTRMYILGGQNDSVYEYSLSSAWDISSASYVQSFSVSTQDADPRSLSFKPDGTKMYVIGGNSDAVHEYDLSTPWDISTASYLQNFSVSAQAAGSDGLFFKPDGKKMYFSFSGTELVYEYSLSSAWDVSSASYTTNFNVASQDATVRGIFWKDDGTQFYIVGASTKRVFSYLISEE